MNRILIIEPEGCGGISQYTFRLFKELDRDKRTNYFLLTTREYEFNGHPDLITFRNLDTSLSDFKFSIRNIILRKIVSFYYHAYNLFYVLLFIKKHKIDIVHFQWEMSKYHLILLKLLKLFNKTIIYTAHNIFSHNVSSVSEALRYRYSLYDKIITHTEESKSELLRNCIQLKEENIFVIPHGPYGPLFYFSNKIEARKKYGFKDDARVLLFFGAIRKYKGLAHLLDAVSGIEPIIDNLRVVIAGKSYYDFEKENKTAVNKISKNLVIINRYIDLREMESFFLLADAVILPYEHIFQSGVCFMAMGYARPLIVSNILGLKEYVKDGFNGYIFNLDSKEELKRAVVNMATMPKADILLMGNNSLKILEKHPTWENIAIKTRAIYESVRIR